MLVTELDSISERPNYLSSLVIESYTYVHVKNVVAVFIYLKQEQTHK